MISIGLPKVALGTVRLGAIVLGVKRGEYTPTPPFWNVANLLLEDGANFLLEEGGCILITD